MSAIDQDKHTNYTWIPIEIIQEYDPIIVNCKERDNKYDDRMFECIDTDTFKMIGHDIIAKFSIESLCNEQLFNDIDHDSIFEDEYEVNPHYEPVKNTIPKKDFEKYVEPFTYEHACKDLGKENLGECMICQDEMKKGDIIGITKCGHSFHKKCIKKWLTKECIHPKCPVCNKDVRE